MATAVCPACRGTGSIILYEGKSPSGIPIFKKLRCPCGIGKRPDATPFYVQIRVNGVETGPLLKEPSIADAFALVSNSLNNISPDQTTSAVSVVIARKNSPEYRAIILNDVRTELGLGDLETQNICGLQSSGTGPSLDWIKLGTGSFYTKLCQALKSGSPVPPDKPGKGSASPEFGAAIEKYAAYVTKNAGGKVPKAFQDLFDCFKADL